MLSAVLGVMAVFLFLLVIWLISYYSMKRKRKAYIHEKFGKIPKNREWNDAVKNYYDVVNDGTGLDDVTWNDLSMNDVLSESRPVRYISGRGESCTGGCAGTGCRRRNSRFSRRECGHGRIMRRNERR